MNKGKQTRQTILNTAFKLFINKGYHGTSMRQIAQNANLALGSIYNHFANKEEIFQAVLLAYHPFLKALPRLQEAEGNTAKTLLYNAAHLIISEIEQEPAIVNLIFIEVVELEGKHLPNMLEKILPQVLIFLQKVQGLSEELRPFPPYVILRTFIVMISGYILSQRLLNDPSNPLSAKDRDSLDDILEIFLHGLILPKTNKTT